MRGLAWYGSGQRRSYSSNLGLQGGERKRGVNDSFFFVVNYFCFFAEVG